MSTRRTRNNPSPSGLKSLPYGPQKRAGKTKQVSQITSSSTSSTNNTSSSTNNASSSSTHNAASSNTNTSSNNNASPPRLTSDHQPSPPSSRKRARAASTSSASDTGPPSKKRINRNRRPVPVREEKVKQKEKEDEVAHDADVDEDGHNMAIVVQTGYTPPQPTSTSRGAESHLEAHQQTDEYSSEEPRSEAQSLEENHSQRQSSEEYNSHQSASEDQHLEQSSRGYNSQAEQISRDPTPAPKSTQVQKKPEGRLVPYVHKPPFLTPKPPPRPKSTTINYKKSIDPATADPELLAKILGRGGDNSQTLPTQNTGMRNTTSPKPVETYEDEEDEDDSDASFSFLDEPKLTRSQREAWREEQRAIREQIQRPRLPSGRAQTTRTPTRNVSQARPSTTISTPKITPPKTTSPKTASPKTISPKIASPKTVSPKIISPRTGFSRITSPKTGSPNITSPSSELKIELILTRPDLIDAALALVKWAERDETRRLPDGQQMEALLESFDAQESADIEPQTPTHVPARNRRHEHGATSRPIQRRRSSSDASEMASADSQSEVSEMKDPKTPTQPQESRGFWNGVSAVKNIFTSPMNFFDRRRNQEDSPEATTNGTSVPAAPSGSHPTTLGDPVTFPTLTPRPTSSLYGSTGRDRRVQTERSRRTRDQAKPPIHLRGIASPSRIAEIHRQQDRLAAARNKKREGRSDEADAEDELNDARSSTPSARTGEKRKRAKGTVRTPPAGPPGTFRVPSPGSSDDSSDAASDEEETEEQERTRIRYTPIPVAPRKDLIDDEGAYASPFTSLPRGPATTGFWNVPDGFQPTYEEPKPSPKKAKAKAKTSPTTVATKTAPSPPKRTSQKSTSNGQPSPTKRSVPKSASNGKPSQTKRSAPKATDSDSSFTFPDGGNESSGSEEEVAAKKKNGHAAQGKNQQPESTALQSKQWTQTPPPKPRPSNAQLPQFPSLLSAAEAAKARAEKFKPKQPSSLRNVTQMSPLQIEKENQLVRGQFTGHPTFNDILAHSGVSRDEWEEANAMQDKFFRYADPDVIAAVNALPDHMVAEYPLPPSLQRALLPAGQSEVEREVGLYFR